MIPSLDIKSDRKRIGEWTEFDKDSIVNGDVLVCINNIDWESRLSNGRKYECIHSRFSCIIISGHSHSDLYVAVKDNNGDKTEFYSGRFEKLKDIRTYKLKILNER